MAEARIWMAVFFFLKAPPSSACTQHWNWGTRGICPRWNSPVWIFTCDSRAPALGHFKTPVLSTVPHLLISPKYVANWKSKPLSSKKNETKLETVIQISMFFFTIVYPYPYPFSGPASTVQRWDTDRARGAETVSAMVSTMRRNQCRNETTRHRPMFLHLENPRLYEYKQDFLGQLGKTVWGA